MKWLAVVVLSTLTVLTTAGGQAAAAASKIGVTAADMKKVEHHVAIPLNHFKSERGKFVLPGATKDELKALPEFVKK